MLVKTNLPEKVPSVLNYRQILENEGVYLHTKSNDRLIVLDGYAIDGPPVVLWLNPSGLRQADKDWEKESFIKTNEKITITLS